VAAACPRDPSVKRAKEELRSKVWSALEKSGVARFPKPVYGRIPNFVGAEEAAERLAEASEWHEAKVVKVNPDSPQAPVREKALESGKTLIVPTPRLRAGFLVLEASRVPRSALREASKLRGLLALGRPISLKELARLGSVDLVVEGSVAVNAWGERLGKGSGYGELEYAILASLGLVGEHTPIFTTVHDLQLLNERLPQDPWDVPIDAVFTPTKSVRCQRARERPAGVFWECVAGLEREMPVLLELRKLLRG